MKSLPEEINEIIITLAHVLRSRGEEQYVVDILRYASVDIHETSYDSGDGSYGFTLNLQIPIALYGKIQDNLEKIEGDILNKLKSLTRAYTHEYLDAIIIGPKLTNSSYDYLQEPDGTDNEIAVESIGFWIKDYLRLFLSHISKYKVMASELQKELESFAISAFVAHEDIEPTKEWQDELGLALSSMDALAALLTEGYSESRWCDQEVGVAIGRKTLVIPIRVGIDPYGFIGKFQGISARDKTASALSEEIFEALLKNESTKRRLTSAVVAKLSNSISFQESKATVKLLKMVAENLTEDMVEKLEEACVNNGQVYNSFGVVEKIRSIIRPQGGR